MLKTYFLRNLLFSGLLISLQANANWVTVPYGFKEGMEALENDHFAEAYCRWKPLAEQGYAEPQYHLGWLYANGNGMDIASDKALYWWKKAAKQGHPEAQFSIGMLHVMDEDGSALQAAEWFIPAAIQGHDGARDLLIQLSLDANINLLKIYPDLLTHHWFGQTGYIATNKANIRAGRGTQYKILKQLRHKATLSIVGRVGRWLQIRLPNTQKTGWILHTLVAF